MKLIKLDNFKLEIEDELLLLKPFRELCKLDKSKDKSKFIEFLTVLYFTFDPRSDYSYIVNEKERLEEVCVSNGFEVKKFTDKEKECIDLYCSLTKTASSQLLEDTKLVVDKLRIELKNFDISSLEEKDKVNALKNITAMVKMIPSLVKDLVEAEKAVTKEMEETGRARGAAAKTLFDDGITLN